MKQLFDMLFAIVATPIMVAFLLASLLIDLLLGKLWTKKEGWK